MALGTLSIDNFGGGRENFDDQTVIQPNHCASGSFNVWAPNGPLINTPGYTLQASFTATAGTAGTTTPGAMPWFIAEETVTTANSLYYRINVTALATNSYAMFGSNGYTDSLTPLGYVTGSVSISGASLISATGNGTSWNTNVSAGDRFRVDSTAATWYKISSVEDNTHLTLTTAVPVSVATGSAYTIQQALDSDPIAHGTLNGIISTCTTGNIMQQYDGSNITRLSAGPKAAMLASHKNYLFGFRTSTAESRLYWSAIKDPTTWPTNNFIDIDVKNGKGAGIISYGNELILFKTRGMFKLIGDVFDPSNPTYYVIKIQTPPDLVFNNHYAAVVHASPRDQVLGGILTFYAQGRIYQYRQGSLAITDISHHVIRDLPTQFGAISNFIGVDQRIKAFSYNGYYVVHGMQDPNNGANPMAMLLDDKGAWWYLRNPNAGSTIDIFNTGMTAIVPSTSARPQLAISLGTGYGKIFTWDFLGPSYGTSFYSNDASSYASSTVAISSKWISKEFNIEYGTFKWIIVYLEKKSSGNLTVQWSIDQGSNVSYTQDMTAGRGNVIRAVIPINQKGSTIQLTLSTNTAGIVFKVYAIKIFYEESYFERIA